MSLPHAFKRIRLHLARQGTSIGIVPPWLRIRSATRYEGHIDVILWKEQSDDCHAADFGQEKPNR